MFQRFLAKFKLLLKPAAAVPRLAPEQVAALRSLRAQEGYKLWLDLIGDAIATECSAVMTAADPQAAFAASQRLTAYGRCYHLLEHTVLFEEALHDLASKRRNGGTNRLKSD